MPQSLITMVDLFSFILFKTNFSISLLFPIFLYYYKISVLLLNQFSLLQYHFHQHTNEPSSLSFKQSSLDPHVLPAVTLVLCYSWKNPLRELFVLCISFLNKLLSKFYPHYFLIIATIMVTNDCRVVKFKGQYYFQFTLTNQDLLQMTTFIY